MSFKKLSDIKVRGHRIVVTSVCHRNRADETLDVSVCMCVCICVHVCGMYVYLLHNLTYFEAVSVEGQVHVVARLEETHNEFFLVRG